MSILLAMVVIPFPGTKVSGQNSAIIEVRADSFGLPLSSTETASLYEKPSVLMQQGDSVRFDVEIEEAGEYTISFDMAATESFLAAPEGQLLIDGAYPFPDTQSIVFPVYYQNSSSTFPVDRYGNDALIRQEALVRWTNVFLRDTNFSQKYPLQVHLERGEHHFEFRLSKETILLGSIYIAPFLPASAYSEYLQANPYPDSSGVSIEIEAEFPSYKNDTAVRPVNSRNLEVTPYDTYRLLLNTLGGETWDRSGSTVYYEFTVPEDGMYLITFRALQNTRNNFTVFRRISINDQVLFDQLNEVPFDYSSKWSDITLGGDTPYRIYLKQGVNVLGIEANDSPYFTAIEDIRQALIDINTISLQIKKLTGNHN
jgi:hypothetical protein